MGANAQTTVPTFTAGDVLTAAQMNQSARTGVPVFADSTARDAAFGGSGEKTLAEGQLCYLEDTNIVQYYDGSSWATVGPATAGALVKITSSTISAQGTVSFDDCFSATYNFYRIILTGITSSATTNMRFRLRDGGTDRTGADYIRRGNASSSGALTNSTATDTHALLGQFPSTKGATVVLEVGTPFDSGSRTPIYNYIYDQGGIGYQLVQLYNQQNENDGCTFLMDSGTFSGHIAIYGFAL
jgi:hypothetical protein